jgi:hypothetical protein
MASSYYVPLGEYIDSLWPKNILEPPPVDQIHGVWIEPPNFVSEPSVNIKTALLFDQELAFTLPGVDGVSIVFAAGGNDSAFLFELFTDPSPGMKVYDVPIAIRFANDLLKPAKLSVDAQGNQVVVADPSIDHVDITLAKITLSASFDGGFGIDAQGGIDLPLCFIGDTGVAIEAKDIRFVGAKDPSPPGRPAGWSGIHIPSAGLWLPGDLGSMVGHLTLTDATIGNGGFSGTIADTWSPAVATTLGGVDLNLSSVALTFVQNSFTECAVHGSMTLPFFDVPVDVELAINLDGSFSVRLASATGLLNLTKPDVLELQVQSMGIDWGHDTLTAHLSGKIRPLVGGLDWPGFEVKDLSIDSKGNVKIDGGWIDLRDGYALDFHGFKIEISKIGFGKTDDGGKWIGFSGGMRLVDGLSAGASVEGLKVTWYDDGSHDPKVTLEGVGVDFEVPDVVSFKGHVSYREFRDAAGNTVKQFDGDIKLSLITLGLEVDAVLVIGSATKPDGSTYTFFAIYLAVELPAGIPLWATGLGLFGLAGLFALQMEPDKRADEAWYGVGPTDGWYKRPQIGVTDLGHKWRNQEGSLAIGGGLTLGTVADNGFTFSGRMLLVLVFPGPILMIEGKANLLKERSKLSDEPIFRALAVLDGRAGTLLFGLDAQYKVGDGGELLDIHGGVEAFFDFHDLDKWHLYLGVDEPREKRIRAHLFGLFEANAYFMLTGQSLRTGAWVGYDKRWNFGPVHITLEAWLETNIAINWKPIHFHGDLWAHGTVALHVFGFGFGLSLDAKVAGDVFDPFHLLAAVSATLDLPWPLPDIGVHFTLEWGPEPDKPPVPMVLKEVAIEHLKVTTSWPLARGSLVLPNYDSNGFIGPPTGPTMPANIDSAPVVPLDCRPHITFGRAVHDVALVGNNPQPPNPAEERIGDPKLNQGPAKVKYVLKGVALEKLVGTTWTAVARKADTANPPGLPELYGSWAPVPAMPGGSATGAIAQVKLWLWSKSAFDYTLNTSGSWDEWFTDHYSSYPCIPDAPAEHICCDFTRYGVGDLLDTPHRCNPDVTIAGVPTRNVHVDRVRPPVDGIDRAACFPSESLMLVRFGRPASHVDVHLVPQPLAERECVGFDDHETGRAPNPLPWHGLEIVVRDEQGDKLPSTRVNRVDGVNGVELGYVTEVHLAAPTDEASVTILDRGEEVAIEAVDDFGSVVSTSAVQYSKQPRTVTMRGSGITMVRILAPAGEAELQVVCVSVSGNADVHAIAELADGSQSAPIYANGDHIVVDLDDVAGLVVRGRGKFCVLEVCVDLGPDPADVLARQEMATHLTNATAQWNHAGNVLEPNARYRLRINTRAEARGEAELAGWVLDQDMEEFAYFRTEGPPGLTSLTVPPNVRDATNFDSGLDDLHRYIKQTVPATVPPSGDKPLLPKPVYRAYDVGIEFNEDYVDLLYRISGRDLGLYLFDNNNRPVRDAAGRLLVRPNEWGIVEQTTFNASEQRWIEIVNSGTCAAIDLNTVPKDVTMRANAAGQVLEADSVHEARLVPLLLHESFATPALGATAGGPSGTLGRWRVVDQGTVQGPSVWKVAATTAPVSRYLVQQANIWGGTDDGVDPLKPGTMLVYTADPQLPSNSTDQPANWTDYRLTAFVRNEDDDAIGLVFRYVDADNHYRFSMDAERSYRRLVRVVNGQHFILDEDDRRFLNDVDIALTVEAIGSSLRVYVDGALALSAEDPSHVAGSVGLYCWASENARFADIKVDDFRNADPVTKRPSPVYRFPFTTSRFAHFTHHVHSFDDVVRAIALGNGVSTGAWMAAAAPLNTAVSDAESRAFDALAHAVLGAAADGFPKAFEVTRLEKGGNVLGYLVRSPEPIDWARVDLRMLSAPIAANVDAAMPNALKITSVSFATNVPREESVGLLTRDALNVEGYAVDARRIPGPIKGSVEQDLLVDGFTNSGLGLLFSETFGPNALDRYEIIDQGDLSAPSSWSVAGGRIRQSSNIAGGALAAADNAKRGTMAITGDPGWASIRFAARMRSTDNDAIGLVFRYVDADNYYRLSLDNERGYRRLVKCIGGTFTTLWEDMTASYRQSVAFDVRIDAFGNRLTALLNDSPLFDVTDDSHKFGRVGLYSWLNVGASFEALRVDALETDPVLMRPDLGSLAGWLVLDPPRALAGPSAWTPGPDGMTQTSLVHQAGADQIGAHLLTATQWDDMQFCVQLRTSSDGTMGALLRYLDKDNWYRFTMNRTDGVHRLEKRVHGVQTVLWQATAGVDLDRTYSLTLRATDSRLAGSLDGVPLFSVIDTDITRGSVGLTTSNNDGALFSNASVLDTGRTIAGYRIYDAAEISAWSTAHGELRQRAMVGVAASADQGTHAVATPDFTDEIRLVVEARTNSDGPYGVVFRYTDERNYYRFSVSTADHVKRLIKMVDGVATTLWETAGGSAPDASHRIVIDALGDRLIGRLDGLRLFEVVDATHRHGRVGLYCSRNDAIAFETVRVSTPPVEAHALFNDKFAGGDLSGWSFIDESSGVVTPNWTVAGGVLTQRTSALSQPVDPAAIEKKAAMAVIGDVAWNDVVYRAVVSSASAHAIGVVFRYIDQDNYCRFSMDRSDGYRRLVKNVGGVFTTLWEDDIAYEVGRAYEVVVVAEGDQLWGYLDGIPLFAVSDADLAHGQVGLYSWRNPGSRFSTITVLPISAAFTDWAFRDNFPYLTIDKWIFVDNGDTRVRSDWTVTDNRLTQTSAISGATSGMGTYCVSGKGGRQWTDSRFTSQIGSSSSGTIGLCARFVDEFNHYRFEMTDAAGSRLVKVVDGVETQLWSDPKNYALDVPVLATLDTVGERITVAVNGVILTEIIDRSLAAGGVAMYCSANTGAFFDFVRVQEAAWQTYHRFGKRPTVPAGQRLRILACGPDTAPAGLPNTVDVHRADVGESGSILFRGSTCDLRVRAPLNRIEHTRTFRRSSQFADIADARVLRRSDGCAFFLCRPTADPDGSLLPPADHRMQLRYRRNNTAADPHSQVQRENGSSADEATTLDWPAS